MVTILGETDQDRLLRRAASRLCDALRDVLFVRRRAIIAVPGGRSVARIFEFMRQERLDWHRVHFFMVDERLVPADHPDSNFRLLREHLIEPLRREGRLESVNAHPFSFDVAKPGQGALEYGSILAEHGSGFDVVLLSAGEDGHVASLFPNHHSIDDARHGFFVMTDSPKPPPGRMTSSASLVRSAEVAVLLFLGPAKAAAYENFQNPSVSLSSCPAKLALAMKSAFVFTDLA